MSNTGCRVAIAIEFLTQFSKLPKKVQNKTSDFLTLFQENPRSSGINYETIHAVKDKNLRSVRIGDDYRGIVCKPETGNVYMLLWIDHHDEAYAWAKKRACKVNPETGAIQVITSIDAPPETDSQQPQATETKLFGRVRDRELLKLGLPEEYLETVRSIRTEKDLDAVAPNIPEEVLDPLYQLAAGYSLEEVHREIDITTEKEVDTEDFSSALDIAESLRRFVVIGSELELQKILEAPLEQWRIFLHPTQRKLVERTWNGSVRVLGGAGTGKTVVAMHRAKWLAKTFLSRPEDKILFTTFTKNLAADIHSNLEKLCPEYLDKIEVINIDSWVTRFLKQKEYSKRICYNNEFDKIWEQALSEQDSSLQLSDAFYRDEWEQVVQPQSVSTREQYFRAKRIGRGTRVNREMRQKIWPVFERYREQMDSAGLMEPADGMREAARIIQEKSVVFPYKTVIVDEAQDMDTQAFILMRAIAGPEGENDMFIVGDAHQRIYQRVVVLGRCGINIRGRSRKLRINYRTTEQIRRHAVAVLSGAAIDDLDGGQDDNKGYKSLISGAEPLSRQFATFDEQIGFIIENVKAWESQGIAPESVCIIARRHKYIDQIEAVLTEKEIPAVKLRPDKAEEKSPGIRLATMHRVKGLEFDAVIVAGLNKEEFPLIPDEDLDPVSYEAYMTRERSLLYVSLTRAKKIALMCCHGNPSEIPGHVWG